MNQVALIDMKVFQILLRKIMISKHAKSDF